jgi:hypothetical protein
MTFSKISKLRNLGAQIVELLLSTTLPNLDSLILIASHKDESHKLALPDCSECTHS